MDTLLAHIVKRYVPSQWENIATDSLHYLLRRDGVEHAVLRVIAPTLRVDEPLLWQTQQVNADLSRPDLVGSDSQGRPAVMIEAKFGASLTDNQPQAYLAAQDLAFPSEPERRILAFVVPSSRRHIVEAEVLRRVGASDDVPGSPTLSHPLPTPSLSSHRVTVVTWAEVLAAIRVAMTASGDHSGLRDLDQLAGLCDRADAESMLPLNDEDLDSEKARRFLDLWRLVEQSVKAIASRQIVAKYTWSSGPWGPGNAHDLGFVTRLESVDRDGVGDGGDRGGVIGSSGVAVGPAAFTGSG